MSDNRKRKKRVYGLGRIFPRGPHKILWIGYSPGRGQKERRESSSSTNLSVASKLLKQRQGEVAAGKAIVSHAKQEKYMFNELADLLLLDHEINDRTDTVKYLVKHLRQYFGLDRAITITDDRILLYMQSRRKEGASDGTVRLELAALSKAFNLAIGAKKLSADARPTFPKISLDNARQGFVSHAEFLALREELPVHLQDPVAFLYYSGWRVSEMRRIRWQHLDTDGLRLPPELSKNKKGRLLPLTGELGAIIKRTKARGGLIAPLSFIKTENLLEIFERLGTRPAWR
jgi:integrase